LISSRLTIYLRPLLRKVKAGFLRTCDHSFLTASKRKFSKVKSPIVKVDGDEVEAVAAIAMEEENVATNERGMATSILRYTRSNLRMAGQSTAIPPSGSSIKPDNNYLMMKI